MIEVQQVCALSDYSDKEQHCRFRGSQLKLVGFHGLGHGIDWNCNIYHVMWVIIVQIPLPRFWKTGKDYSPSECYLMQFRAILLSYGQFN